MATRGKKPGQDLADLKARLGLNKSLTKKPEPEPEPEPVAPAPAATAAPAARNPSAAAPPHTVGGASSPMAAPQQAGQPQPAGPGGPPYAGPPRGGPPPGFIKPKPKPEPEKPAWQPPASDPSAATDVPIVAHQSPAQRYGPFGVAIVVGIILGGLGYMFGGVQIQRNLYNIKSRDAARVLAVVQEKVEALNAVKAAIAKHDGKKPDPELLKRLTRDDYLLDPNAIVVKNLLLGPTITNDLLSLTSDTKLLYSMSRNHAAMVNNVDKKELQDLQKDSKLLESYGFAVMFDASTYVKSLDSKDFRPAQGNMVVFDKQDPITKEDKEKYLKVRRPSSGNEFELPMKSMILVPREEMIRSTGPNALSRYQLRHRKIEEQLKKMAYADALVEKLDELANRGDAPLLAVGSDE
ncbi:MAG: hypothetical protein AAFS10_12735 [Myxococcota bacterium]